MSLVTLELSHNRRTRHSCGGVVATHSYGNLMSSIFRGSMRAHFAVVETSRKPTVSKQELIHAEAYPGVATQMTMAFHP